MISDDPTVVYGISMVDVTCTGVTRGDGLQRNQQRNWETVLQTFGLLTQPQIIQYPEKHYFTKNDNFQRKSPGRNNHNASKLIQKYSNLAREALSGGDKILSENYFQHADHFTRILNEQDAQRKLNTINNDLSKSQQNIVKVNEEQNDTDKKKTVTQIK